MSRLACRSIDAWFYRFSDGTFTNLSKRYGGVWWTRMSGSRIVWTEQMQPHTQIVLYDTADDSRRVLAPGDGGQWNARIEGRRVVWVDHRNAPGDHWDQGNSDIYLHDLHTGKTVAVTTHPALQDWPDVYGDWVVWEDWRHNPNPVPKYASEFHNADIYAKNIRSGKELRLTDFPGMEGRPQVDRGRVFFRMRDAKDVVSIFMLELPEQGR